MLASKLERLADYRELAATAAPIGEAQENVVPVGYHIF
jgi:hypothetical protein